MAREPRGDPHEKDFPIAGRLYYRESQHTMELVLGVGCVLMTGGTVFVVVHYPGTLFETLAGAFVTIVIGLFGLVLILLGLPRKPIRVTGQGLVIPERTNYRWDQIARLTRTAGYMTYSGRRCPKCGGYQCSYMRTGIVGSVLNVYSTDGTRLARVSGPMQKAIDDEWNQFSDAVRAVAPHVVIEELTNQRREPRL